MTSTSSPIHGYSLLYPDLYTPEQALELKDRTFPKLWSFALDVCVAGGVGNFYLSAVNRAGVDAVIVNKRGIPVFVVTARELGGSVEYTIKNWSRHFKLRGKDRYRINSTNRTYLLKQMALHYSATDETATGAYMSQLDSGARAFGKHLNDDTNSAVKIDPVNLKPETAMDLLRLAFEPGYTQMRLPVQTVSKLQEIYAKLQEKFAAREAYMSRIEDMFAQPKWILGVVPYDSAFMLLVGVATIKATQLNEWGGRFEYVFESHFKLYRDLEHFYATHPQEADSLKAALTFCKVNREKDNMNGKSYDKEGFLPVAASEIYEDVGGFAYGTPPAGIAVPQWLLLSK